MYRLLRHTFKFYGGGGRNTWRNLGQFASSENEFQGWNLLKLMDEQVQNCINHFGQSTKQENTEIDWDYWANKISHKEILSCVKNFYCEEVKKLDMLMTEKHIQKTEKETIGWDLFENQCIKSCEKSVDESNTVVQNAARALWISYNNPPINTIDPNDWLDSDDYWSAYVEKHNLYNPKQGVDDPESENEIQEKKSSWHSRVSKFNDRSDTPILFQYMEQLPSWEFYDIHRRAFLEHMTYYLIRTGNDYRFFPEIPPIEWLTNIEQLRYQFVSVAQRRRAHFQLENLERERALEMQPINFHADGEEHYQKFINNEVKNTEMFVARLMGNYMFLCHPFVPIQSTFSLLNVMSIDNGRGEIYSFGDDVNALFYLPVESYRFIPSPRIAFNSMMDYLTITGRRLNPAYATLLEIHADLVESRGEHWMQAPDESMAEAFVRRLGQETGELTNVFRAYADELAKRIDGRQRLLDLNAIYSKLRFIESISRLEQTLYRQLIFADGGTDGNLHTSESGMEQRASDLAHINSISSFPDLPPDLYVTDELCGHQITTPEVILNSLSQYQIQKDAMVGMIKSIIIHPMDPVVKSE